MIPLAHAGHWSASLIYLAPVVLIVVALWVQTRRERRDQRRTSPGDIPSADDQP